MAIFSRSGAPPLFWSLQDEVVPAFQLGFSSHRGQTGRQLPSQMHQAVFHRQTGN